MKAFRELLFFALTVMSTSSGQEADMIVFVHGTLKPAEFSLASILKVMGNNIGNSLYSKTNSYIRDDPYFYQSQAMQGLGLQPIVVDTTADSISACLAKMFELQYKAHGYPDTSRLYYTFGWSGLLNVQEREKEGENFYLQLSNEIKRLKNEGKNPKVHIISFSHGGNVSLNLASAKRKIDVTQHELISIATLVLLGMPVQKATDHLVTDTIFEKVYHLYSTEDSIQTLDILSPKQLFSDRTFKSRSDFSLPEKLVQIRLRITRRVRGLHKIEQPPDVPHEVLTHKHVKRIHKDPQHTELWCFKWGAHWYRDLFPLKPLPTVAFLPSILHIVQTKTPEYKNITVDYVPSHQGAVLIPEIKHNSTACAILNKEQTEQLYQLAHTHEPKNFSLEKQQEKIEAYVKKAQAYLKKIKGEKAARKSRLLTNLILKSRRKVSLDRIPNSQKIRHV